MKSDGNSIVGLVCGILGVIGIFTFTFPLLTWICFGCAIIGIIFGAMGMSASKKETGKASGLAVAGVVCGFIGVVLGTIGVMCSAYVYSELGVLGCAKVFLE